MRLRAGAEKLYQATTNKKLKNTIALELSFVNSNLQLLKEQLAELNSSVECYQNDTENQLIPMIPLGLKETKEINFMEQFSDFILEHYSEDCNLYEDAIADLTDLRQVILFNLHSILYVIVSLCKGHRCILFLIKNIKLQFHKKNTKKTVQSNNSKQKIYIYRLVVHLLETYKVCHYYLDITTYSIM